MVTTGSAHVKERIDSERNQGRAPDMDWLDHDRLGFNYRLSDIASAIGLVAARAARRDARRPRARRGLYREALAGIEGLGLPCEDAGGDRRGWFVFVVQVPRGSDRDEVVRALRERGVAEQAVPAGDPPDELLPRALRPPRGRVPGLRGRRGALARAAVLPRDDRGRGRARGARSALRRRGSACASHRDALRRPSPRRVADAGTAGGRSSVVRSRERSREVSRASRGADRDARVSCAANTAPVRMANMTVASTAPASTPDARTGGVAACSHCRRGSPRLEARPIAMRRRLRRAAGPLSTHVRVAIRTSRSTLARLRPPPVALRRRPVARPRADARRAGDHRRRRPRRAARGPRRGRGRAARRRASRSATTTRTSTWRSSAA